jgi:transcriptional regulator with XRE-family HTH domain
MPADEYRDTIKRLGLTQAGAGRFLGVTEVTSRRWATGRVLVPQTVAKLLSLMVALKLTPEKVDEWLENAGK